MPQLDLYSILNQFFWGFIFFVTFYYFITFYFIPTLFTSLYARKFFINSRSDEVSNLVACAFLTHVLISIQIDQVSLSLQQLIDYAIYPKIVCSSTYASAFDIEFEKAFTIEENNLEKNEKNNF